MHTRIIQYIDFNHYKLINIKQIRTTMVGHIVYRYLILYRHIIKIESPLNYSFEFFFFCACSKL